MKGFVLSIIAACSFCIPSFGQPNYATTIRNFQALYMYKHEVVKQADRKYFRFFKIDQSYQVTGTFEKITDTVGFTMKTSAGTTQEYFRYGKVSFTLHDTTLQLFIYQSKTLRYTSYKDYLFLPFMDLTTGDQSYGSGRYIDLRTGEINNNMVVIDFNKAYNPYCAYVAGYHCPVPPKENFLKVAVLAGEKVFAKPIH